MEPRVVGNYRVILLYRQNPQQANPDQAANIVSLTSEFLSVGCVIGAGGRPTQVFINGSPVTVAPGTVAMAVVDQRTRSDEFIGEIVCTIRGYAYQLDSTTISQLGTFVARM